jgi:ferric enterobactin receptor
MQRYPSINFQTLRWWEARSPIWMGFFKLDVKPGTYFLQAEFISYRAAYVEGITLTKKEPFRNVGTMSLQPDAEILAEVEVRAQKSQTTLALDKKVFNVGKDLANKGGNAADLLDNVPSVTVDLEGNVNLRGSGNVRILVNGKPSGLVGFSNSNGLRQIPATLIDRIEVITNPSARYEAEGMAGIINIILKKEEQRGFNGSVEGTVGYPDNYGVSANVNYRTDRLNFFGTYGLVLSSIARRRVAVSRILSKRHHFYYGPNQRPLAWRPLQQFPLRG